MEGRIKLCITDDHTLFRKGLISMFEDSGSIEVIMQASDGQDLINRLENSKTLPDVILMDLKMPNMDGIEATKHIVKHFNGIKIVVLTMLDSEKFVLHLLKVGANGYLLKDAEEEEVENAIHTVFEKGYYFNDHVSEIMQRDLRLRNTSEPVLNQSIQFSNRELQVLRLICKELTSAEIADRLFLGVRTVEGYRNRLLDKVGARNVAGLVMYAVRNGLIVDE